jgi:hypothetical protein
MIIRAVIIILIIFGIITIITSAIFSSSFLAIFGTSFIFWCSIVLFITPTKYVPLALLTASTTVNISNTERILAGMGFDQKGVYLPPKNLKDIESSLLFVPKFSGQELPSSEEVTMFDLLNNKHNALFLTPSGFALSKIFEKQAGLSFTKIDLSGLQKMLIEIIVENLRLAEDINIQIQGTKIMIVLKNSVFVDDYQETQKKFPRTYNVVGCLFSSSLACVLAKVTGQAIILLNEEFITGTSQIEYQMLAK